MSFTVSFSQQVIGLVLSIILFAILLRWGFHSHNKEAYGKVYLAGFGVIVILFPLFIFVIMVLSGGAQPWLVKIV